MQLIQISLKDIDPDDDSYRTSFHPTGRSFLYDSIKSLGLLQPLVVQKKNTDKYRLVCGFRRYIVLNQLSIECARSFVISEKTKSARVFTLALQDNVTIREFTPIDISIIINKLESDFAIQKNEVINQYFPLVGLQKNPKIYQRYKPLAMLPKRWQHGILADTISIEIASQFADRDEKEREAMWHIITNLKPGKNRQREILRLLDDIARIEQKGVPEIIKENDALFILNDKKLTPSQKMSRFKDFLWKKRYPRYMTVEEKFDHLVHQAKCPPDIQLQHPPFFEGETFHVSFAFKSSDDFAQKIQFLQTLNDNDIIKKITRLA